jgi:hypothetical protein
MVLHMSHLPMDIPMWLPRRVVTSTSCCGAQGGLQELTPDISKLVKLRVLRLHNNVSIPSIPGCISCLQKLQELCVHHSHIEELPLGLAALPNLTSIDLFALMLSEFRFPFPLQVIDPIPAACLCTAV